jgi:hypothetical protein
LLLIGALKAATVIVGAAAVADFAVGMGTADAVGAARATATVRALSKRRVSLA